MRDPGCKRLRASTQSQYLGGFVGPVLYVRELQSDVPVASNFRIGVRPSSEWECTTDQRSLLPEEDLS